MSAPESVKARVLYIEDAPVNKMLVRKLLRANGYGVIEADDGLSGIEAAENSIPDIILMDMSMPGLDGYEAATRIKSTASLSHIPIIAVTANSMSGDRELCLTAGCSGFIAKPINVSTFVSEIESYLKGREETVEKGDEAEYLKEYSKKLVERLETKVRELEENNSLLEKRVDEKVEELKSAQTQLLQSEKMASIGQLAAGVAHEINNPVGYINSNMGTLTKYLRELFQVVEAYEMLEQEAPDGTLKDNVKALKDKFEFTYVKDDVFDLLQEAQEGVTRVKQIVQDLKDFSHVDEAEWQRFDIHQGIESTLNIVNNEIKYKAEIVKDYAQLPEIECIASQLNQVLLNLLVNAAHAIEGNGRICIKTEVGENDTVVIEISDSGKGISEVDIPRVFEPFFTTKPVGHGTGLGLSLSYGIIKKHKGRITVESEEGVGTAFSITLPIKQ